MTLLDPQTSQLARGGWVGVDLLLLGRALGAIQDKILQMLEDVKGDVLDDEALIEYLGQSKVKSKEINEKVAEGEITEKSIDETREVYRKEARLSAVGQPSLQKMVLVVS